MNVKTRIAKLEEAMDRRVAVPFTLVLRRPDETSEQAALRFKNSKAQFTLLIDRGDPPEPRHTDEAERLLALRDLAKARGMTDKQIEEAENGGS